MRTNSIHAQNELSKKEEQKLRSCDKKSSERSPQKLTSDGVSSLKTGARVISPGGKSRGSGLKPATTPPKSAIQSSNIHQGCVEVDNFRKNTIFWSSLYFSKSEFLNFWCINDFPFRAKSEVIAHLAIGGAIYIKLVAIVLTILFSVRKWTVYGRTNYSSPKMKGKCFYCLNISVSVK